MSLVECVSAWRKTRHPRWAVLADLLTEAGRPVVGAGKKQADLVAWRELEKRSDPNDLPRLFEALKSMPSTRAAELLPVLAAWNDPRSVTELLRLLEAPPWRAKTATPFFRAAAKLLAESKDVRARDGMAGLGARYKSIIDSSMGDDVGNLLRRTAEEMELIERQLSDADERRLAELEAGHKSSLEAARQSASAKKRAEADEQTLLEAIWAAPADDTPRLVYADALLQRGDVRGELITLQVNRARGRASPESREREYALLTDSKRFVSWTSPVSQGGECLIERGFPATVTVNGRAIKSVASHPAWATVTALRNVQTIPRLHLPKLLAACASLESVELLEEEQIELVAEHHGANLKAITLDHVPAADALAAFPKLERFGIQRWQAAPLPPGLFAPVPGLRSLELGRVALTQGHFDALPSLAELQLLDDPGLRLPQTVERLSCNFAVTARHVEGLPLRSLRALGLRAEGLLALIAATPTLREVEIDGIPNDVARACAGVFESSPLERLRVNRFTLTAGMVLEVRMWDPSLPSRLQELGLRLSGVRWRPSRTEPNAPARSKPNDEEIGPMRDQLAALAIPLEIAWW